MVVKENSIDAAVNYVEKAHGLSLAKHSLTLTKENSVCSDGSCPLVSGLWLCLQNVGCRICGACYYKMYHYLSVSTLQLIKSAAFLRCSSDKMRIECF